MGNLSLSDKDDIWILKPEKEDLVEAAKYAAITLPWTFNRMMNNTGASGQINRALNIAKGIAAQEMLKKVFESKGIKARVQRKSYREDDLFDFRIDINGEELSLDLKTFNHFSNYQRDEREELSKELIVSNSGYGGPDWRKFFPMLIPHTQIGQSKEAYCFALGTSIDFRKDVTTDRDDYCITAFPYKEFLPFLSSKKLCLKREEAGEGIYINCNYAKEPSLFNTHDCIDLKVFGEWDGQMKVEEVVLKSGDSVEVGPFSCIASFQIPKDSFENLEGNIEVEVSRNEFTTSVRNTSRRNINVPPDSTLTFGKDDFCNLILPRNYTLFVLGWITKEDYLAACTKYTGWVWPNDRVDKYKNQPWSQITEKDRKMLKKTGFERYISSNPRLIDAGFMKTTGLGSGAYCYVYPNIGRGGGIRENNLYVLPQDLNIMDNLG
ncbi:hypothetical protein AAV35_011385 [Salimicrobium jeotgali]|uniref:Restriction endonuclease n=1 Tax=Salimicrobium jeotgali TaxID=1230341 RepID=K2G844_9BACI|nr:hypothetical protein [Salimicrobium jeotgali]AKG05318.1 hypothetical protein AAV35_011385 [Salimicrobium jeotgali]EKE31323.1 hypothetical protein MJ3_08806 [Salimicrobium jeotgali]MBM7696932.1 hypothetical protein [Salimicrobium jeotgali]